jgi:hypothetical protein
LSYTVTGPWSVIKPPQFIEETVYGVTPTASPAFVYCGPLVEMTHNVEIGYLDQRHIGSRDLYSQIQTGIEYSFDITFNPVDEKMINYGINLPSGTGTIEKSISILFSQKINGVEHFIIYSGCRCDTTDIEITSDSAVEVSQTWLARDRVITSTANAGLTTPNFIDASEVTTLEPWTNLSGTTGADSPLTWNTGGNFIDTNSFSCSVTNNLERIKPNGQKINKFVEPTMRDIEWEFSTWLKDIVFQGEAATPPAGGRAMEYTLKTSPGFKLVFAGCRINSETSSDSTGATESKMLELAGKATTITMEAIA